MDIPLLSVCLITYNHVNYIKQAIDGVLMQKVDFAWELIIADDFSTDGTREIVLEYKNKYPDLIKLILQEKNVGAVQNFIDLITAPKSKYIAYFEGDDYWTDPLKLQKQVDFLETNPDFVMCYTQAQVVDYKGEILKESYISLCKDYSRDELIQDQDALLPTLTCCFRSNCLYLPEEFYFCKNGDTFMFSILGCSGKSKYLGDIKPSAYRWHSSGVWSSLSHTHKSLSSINTYYWMSRYYSRIGKNEYSQSLQNKYKNITLSVINVPLRSCTRDLLRDIWIVWQKYYYRSDNGFNFLFYANFMQLFIIRLLYVYIRDFIKLNIFSFR